MEAKCCLTGISSSLFLRYFLRFQFLNQMFVTIAVFSVKLSALLKGSMNTALPVCPSVTTF